MSGIEFRVPRSDHRKVEDFLATSPDGVSGIQLEVTNLKIHCDLAAAASAADMTVTVDPLTERLCFAGFNPERIAYGDLYPIDVPALFASSAARADLTERVLAAQRPHATKLIPPHFFVTNHAEFDLNVALTRQAVALSDDLPLRPIVAVSNTFLNKPGVAEAIASAYRHAGITELELRISPIGGNDEGPLKVRRALAVMATFQQHGINVWLGSAGLVGHAALALGLADGFSVGVGYREKYDHKAAISNQTHLDDEPEDDADEDKPKGPRGAVAGVYLVDAQVTVARNIARVLYDNPAVRRHLGCRLGNCAHSVNGPLLDPRGHYLHAQASEVAATLERPGSWRPTLLRDRLTRAQEVRDAVFQSLPEGLHRPKDRTIATLVGEIERSVSQRRSA